MLNKRILNLIVKKFEMEHENALREAKKISMALNKRKMLHQKLVAYEKDYYNQMNACVEGKSVFIIQNGSGFIAKLNVMIESEEKSIFHLSENMQVYAERLNVLKNRLSNLDDLLVSVIKEEGSVKSIINDRKKLEMVMLNKLRG